MIEVRAVTVEEWSAMRTVRLAALAESPQLFGSTTAAEERLDEAEWRRRTQRCALAWDGTRPVGIVAWVWTEEPIRADLVAMWIDPDHRGRAIGTALVRWVVAEVVVTRRAVLELGVVADNTPAVELYRRMGFIETGRQLGTRSGDVLRRMRYAPPAPSLTPA
jgi:ribosomal protein S18 acetylase RimI-like enzyme